MQVPKAGDQLPVGEEPSPAQDELELPVRPNPVLQVKVAVDPCLSPSVLAIGFALSIFANPEQVTKEKRNTN